MITFLPVKEISLTVFFDMPMVNLLDYLLVLSKTQTALKV
jgi:hypothetical protein